MPDPKEDESREDFVNRCIPIVLNDGAADDRDQAVAMCNSIWKQNLESKAMAEPHDVLLNHVRSRSKKRTGFNYGLLTADRYVETMRDLVGVQAFAKHACSAVGESASFDDVMQKAANTLTYSVPEMEVKGRKPELPTGVEKPKNTLMVFRHVLTTSKKDRDGDILRTGGAEIDPKMLLLWQHVHTLPIGKMLAVASHTKDELQLYSCIVDMNDLCHDAAVMVDNDMGRFSHGFRALDFLEIKAGREGDDSSPGGYDVKRFEVLEESLVSVPANPDSETQEVLVSLVEGGKLTSGLMKDCAQNIRKRMPLSVPVELDLKVMVNGQEVKDANQRRDEEGDEPGASKEAEAVSVEGKEEKGAEDEKVKSVPTTSSPGRMLYSGDLSGSWEWIEQTLRANAKRYLMSSGLSLGEHDWATTIGTYQTHAIIAVDRMGQYEYYQANWTMANGVPEFRGEPKNVVIETTTEIREKMKRLREMETKGKQDTKPPPEVMD
jgi:hypothetical protein